MGFLRPGGILGGVFFARDFVVAEDVAAAAAGLEQGLAGFFAKFAAEAVHVDFNEVGKRIEGFVPDVFGDFGAADNAAGVAGEIFEERVFLGSERDGTRAAFRGLLSGVEFEIADYDTWGTEFVGAAEEGAEAGEEFAEFEWLGEVIVGAGIETFDAVVDAVFRGEHKNWRALAACADGFADGETVQAGDHDVEDDQIVIVDFGLVDGVVSVLHSVDGVGLFAQTFGHESCDARVVFDEEKSHARIIRQFFAGQTSGVFCGIVQI